MHIRNDFGVYSLLRPSSTLSYQLVRWRAVDSDLWKVIGIVHGNEASGERLAFHAGAHESGIKSLAVDQVAAKLTQPMIDYLLALPEDVQPLLWSRDDEEAWSDLRNKVQRSLIPALHQDDPYRAAYAFDRSMQDGSPDVGLVRFFETHKLDLVAEARSGGLKLRVAKQMEQALCERSQLIRRDVRQLREAGSRSTPEGEEPVDPAAGPRR